MDKWMNSKWMLRIIALLFALMLHMAVSMEVQPKQTAPRGLFPIATTELETITDVPVATYYNQEQYVVSGIPEQVTVRLDGPASEVKARTLQRDFEVFADLRDLPAGQHKVRLQYKNISDRVDVSIQPVSISVMMQEREEKAIPVEVEMLNKDQVKDGYKVETPIISPNSVKVTGSKVEISNINRVIASIDLKGVNETIEKEARVVALDKNNNEIPVDIEPSVVEVTVPITSPSKTIPLKINRKGTLNKELSIVKVEAVPAEITIYGPLEVINGIEFINNIDIDLDDITEDTVEEVEVPVPDGVKKVSPEKIKVNIDVEKAEQKTLNNIPIEIMGLDDRYNINFMDPENALLDISIYGASSVIDKIEADDIQIYINTNELSKGEHELNLEVNGPQNIYWELPRETVIVNIAEK